MKTSITDSVAKILLVCMVSLFVTTPSAWTAGTVVAWGINSYGEMNVPAGLTNVVAVAAGGYESLALLNNGSVVSWGEAGNHGSVPDRLPPVVAIGSGQWHSLVLQSDGQVAGWGTDSSGQISIPPSLTFALAIAVGGHHNLALSPDGRVVAWGYNASGEINVPLGLSDVAAIAAGYSHSLALKMDGTVISWGSMNQSTVPLGLTNIVGIAGGWNHSLALKMDGTVISWGGMNQSTVPAGLSNAVAISAGNAYSVALRSDGTVVAWGSQTNVPAGLSNVVAIAGGYSHSLALVGDGTPLAVSVLGPSGRRAYTGETVTFRVSAAGAKPLFYQWRKNGVDLAMQTNTTLTLVAVQVPDAGDYSVMVSNSSGSFTSKRARLAVVNVGAPEIRADGETLSDDVTRGDLSTISMSSLFPSGTIFYTTNGSPPDFFSTPYLGPFIISRSAAIRAIAYSADFTQSAEDGTYQVQIVPTYGLTRLVTGQGTVSDFPHRARHMAGATVSLRAYPATGWRFLRWQGDACGNGTDAALVMDANKVVTAVFEQIPVYSLTATTAGGGTIAGNIGSPYVEGNVVGLTAEPAAGWQFMRWDGDASGTTPRVGVPMSRAKNVRAVFGTTVTTTVGGSGSLTLTPAQGPYPYGSTVWISARPNAGSYFAVWGSAASGRVNPLPFVVTTANPTVSVLFAPLQGSDVNAYVNVSGEGTVSASPNAQPYAPGTAVTLTASPSPGWRFVEWQGEASGTSPDATVVLTVSKTVTAIFELLPRFALSATTPGGGTISGNTSATYAAGDVVTLTAQPAFGWLFMRWEGDASGTALSVSVTMNQAKNVQAVFGTTIFRNSVGAGALSLDWTQGPYPYGSTVTLTATPNVGSFFASWGNDASGSENPLEFIVTKANPAICALFSSGQNTAPPSITAQPVSQSVIVGGDASFHVTASGTSPFTYQWRKDGAPLGAASSSTLFLDGVAANGGGAFDVVVANAYGSITSAVATLTVVFPPSITVQPVGQVVASGTAVTLSVVAGGTEPVAYQWLNGTGPIPNATNASYTIDSASINDAVITTWPWPMLTARRPARRRR